MFRKPKRKNVNIRSRDERTNDNPAENDNNNQGLQHQHRSLDQERNPVMTVDSSHLALLRHDNLGLKTTGSADDVDEEEDDDAIASHTNSSLRIKRFKATTTTSAITTNKNVMHSYESKSLLSGGRDMKISAKDLITSTVDYHPVTNKNESNDNDKPLVGFGTDGIFRNLTKNAFHAGPIKAPTNIRSTARFDYQPDVCKDYKETGFCGYGDTCIYLHDRSDTISGWQLELQYEQQQKLLKQQQQEQLVNSFIKNYKNSTNKTSSNHEQSPIDNNNDIIQTDDSIPFACYICRQAFINPIVTKCSHYFCEHCIMQYIRDHAGDTDSSNIAQCPICGSDTGSIFNEPAKLITKVKRVLGLTNKLRRNDTISKDLWEEYYNVANKL